MLAMPPLSLSLSPLPLALSWSGPFLIDAAMVVERDVVDETYSAVNTAFTGLNTYIER